MNDTTVVYEANQRLKKSWIASWVEMFRNIIKSRELIAVLFKRDFFASYKKSFLGWIWIFISPIVGIISWVILNSSGILNPGNVGIDYPPYVLLSSSIWGLFMGFYGSAASTLGAGAEFIMQVKYPHEALLAKQTALHITNFFITFLINIVVLVLYGVPLNIGILLLPIVMLPLFFLGAALGLAVSVISVVASDISNIINIGMGFVFYLTPIIYSNQTSSPLLNTVMQLNPLTYLIGGVRSMMLYGRIDNFGIYMLCSVVSFILFLFSLRLFYVSEQRVVEKML
jgi:ABC-type polysaccharide/polyol phosphate export permease